MKLKTIQEGKALVRIPIESKISKKLPIFYNPIMKPNRDISIFLLNSIPNKKMQIALPLSGSGIRGIRFLLELKKGKIKTVFFNDLKDNFFEIIKDNFLQSMVNPKKSEAIVSRQDANEFMIQSAGFDYIDLDPFGTPNPFLDSSAKRISRGGILAVTATDTSALAGAYEGACKRKYWAKPLRNELKHEFGLRILIRKVQLIGAQFDKALTPIYSYSKDHYMRVFFKCEKGKTRVDEIIKQHKMYMDHGPIWVGDLWDAKLANKIAKECKNDKTLRNFLNIIASESKIPSIGFFDLHVICKQLKITIPKFDLVIEKIKKKKFKVSRTHFTPTGIKSNISLEKLLEIMANIENKS